MRFIPLLARLISQSKIPAIRGRCGWSLGARFYIDAFLLNFLK